MPLGFLRDTVHFFPNDDLIKVMDANLSFSGKLTHTFIKRNPLRAYLFTLRVYLLTLLLRDDESGSVDLPRIAISIAGSLEGI